MTGQSQNVGSRLGAIALVLLTVAAITFGVINFQQRLTFDVPEDGVSWLDTEHGVQAFYVAPSSPGERAGIKPGDVLLSIDGQPVYRAVQVAKRLWNLGIWSQARYQMTRQSRSFDTRLIVAAAPKPLSIENYLRVVGSLYLFIGVFIFARRWNAARAVHFYTFCLASFVLCSFHYTGKMNTFDWEVYWAKLGALLIAPALLVHFALVFPERSIVRRFSSRALLLACYLPPLGLLIVHTFVATDLAGFVPASPSINWNWVIWAPTFCWRRRFSCAVTGAHPAECCANN